jgi:hypothetical protein
MSDKTSTGKSAAELFGSNRMWGLKELALPEPVSWWPQTVGWYVLSVMFLCLLAWFGWRRLQSYKRNFYRREGMTKLDSFASNPAAIVDLPLLLRLSALHAAPRVDVAGLRGSDWIAWLNESTGRKLFEENDARLLDELVFASPDKHSMDSKLTEHLVEASKIWMRSHRASI